MMIGTRKIGKPNSETLCSENQRKIPRKKLEVRKQEKRENDDATTENVVVKTTTAGNPEEDKLKSVINTSFKLDVSDNPYIMSPPIESPPKTPELPPIVVGFNPTNVRRYNLRPNPKPNANPDSRMPDSITTESERQT